MVKANSTQSAFLTLMKWLVLGWLILYIWRALKSSNTGIIEGYDDTGGQDFSQFDRDQEPLNHTLEPVELSNAQCNECTSASARNNKSGKSVSGGKLLPVMDPCFNMREVCKQCILLEDHLNSEGKDCIDCIRKHTLAIEALCEEAVGLDKDGKYPDIHCLPEKCRNLSRKFIKGDDLKKLAQEYRVIRKDLMKKYYASF